MEIKCEKSDLEKKVQITARAVSARSTLPILNNLLIDTREDSLYLAATDLEIGIKTAVSAQITATGATTLPAKLFSDIISSLPEGEVIINTDEKHISTIQCCRSNYTLHGMDATEFPLLQMPEVAEGGVCFEISQRSLQLLIKQTIFAASTDEARAILTGALFGIDNDSVKLVATDTHRLAIKSAMLERPTQNINIIVPARALSELSRLFGAEEDAILKISCSENQILFQVAQTSLLSRLIEGQFPAYEKVIPTEFSSRLTLNKEEFLRALRRASVLAREDVNKVVLKADAGTLQITAESPEVGKSHEELQITLEGNPIEIAFNAKYLIDALAVIDADEVYFELQGALQPGVVKYTKEPDYDYVYVVMPMQIL